MDKFMKALDFDSDTLGNVKRDMNFVLQRLIGNMMEKGSTNGSLTLKIDVSFTQEYIPYSTFPYLIPFSFMYPTNAFSCSLVPIAKNLALHFFSGIGCGCV